MSNFKLLQWENISKGLFLAMDLDLFINEKYKDMPLEAKNIYAFLKRRLYLSFKNGTYKDENTNVYVIATREELGKFFGLSIPTIRKNIKELIKHDLLREEKFQGYNSNKKLYLGTVESSGEHGISNRDSTYYKSINYREDSNINKDRTNFKQYMNKEYHNSQNNSYEDLDEYFQKKYGENYM